MLAVRDTADGYGFVSIWLHWLVAATVFGLFALGWWMVDLTYYDAWYKRAPDLHKSIGVLLFAMMLVRLLWRSWNPRVTPEPNTGPLAHRLAVGAHFLLYLLSFTVMISGYLISTADGHGVSVFDSFQVPALLSGLPQQADIAGRVHRWLAYALVGLAALHALAALKHHFIDRDRTLKKMFCHNN